MKFVEEEPAICRTLSKEKRLNRVNCTESKGLWRKVQKSFVLLPKMAPIRFVIPLQRQDLLNGGTPHQYFVENEYSIRELKTKLVVSFFDV